ncbi:MAG TPA: fructosamine kinase family protein [Solirubrobacteraceae bacterium]|nr:fructosamine kinase family protein [Solirubrobacteraceae bacterium]
MSLPGPLAHALRAATGRDARDATRAAGGDINQAWRVELDDETLAFVKTRPDAPRGEFTAEAGSLRWLGEPDGGLGVPEVLGVAEGDAEPGGGGARLLALGWLDESAPGDPAALGRGLAAVHQAGATAFGAPTPLRIGRLTLPNEPRGDWPAFYAEQRLRPLLRPAADRGALSAAGVAAVERVCERLPELAGPPEPPARLHGDLWSGNVLWSGGRPYLIDPVAYGGHREVDLAMLRLFGSPGPGFLEAYEERAPLSAGHAERVALWQLFPLLVHAALFGGSYGASAERAARRYG